MLLADGQLAAQGHEQATWQHRLPVQLLQVLPADGLVTSNTCDRVTRSRGSPCPARGYSTEEVGPILDVHPDTIQGRRDRGILLVFVPTGSRRSEVIDLKASDITIEDGTVYYSDRGEGGKRERQNCPRWALGGHPADAEGLRKGAGPDGPYKSVRSSPPR